MVSKLTSRPAWQKLAAAALIIVLSLGILQVTSPKVQAYGTIIEDPGGVGEDNEGCETFPTGAPTELKVDSFTTNSVDLSWKDGVCAEDMYVVESKTGTGNFVAYTGTRPANAIEATIGDLQLETEYTFRVVAKKGTQLSAYSNSVTVKTLSQKSSYNGQWVYSGVRIFNVYEINNYNASPANARALATFMTGPSAWKVKYCVNGTMSSIDGVQIGSCSGHTAEINETWTASEWKASRGDGIYTRTGSSSAISLGTSFVVKGTNSTDLALNTQSNKVLEVGGCQGNGRVYRTGLYGIMFSEGSGCDGNRPGGQWAFSELPMKWTVNGTVTTIVPPAN